MNFRRIFLQTEKITLTACYFEIILFFLRFLFVKHIYTLNFCIYLNIQ
jgi:hypothetical protein